MHRDVCSAAARQGITANVLDRVEALVKAKVDVVVLDSAHGHSENVLHCVRMIKEAYPDLQVIAGNVATGEATKASSRQALTRSRLVSDRVPSVRPVS